MTWRHQCNRIATAFLVFIYGIYLLGLLSMLVMKLTTSPPSGAPPAGPVTVFSIVAAIIWGLGYLVFPFYISIFHRVFEQLRGWDFVILCSPIFAWLVFTFTGAGKSVGNVIMEPAPVFLLTGAYFLAPRISRRLPRVRRSTINLGLLFVMLAGTMIIVYFVPDMGGGS